MMNFYGICLLLVFSVWMQKTESLTTFGRSKIQDNTTENQSVEKDSQLQNCDEEIRSNVRNLQDSLENLKERVEKLESSNENALYDEHFNCIKNCTYVKRLPKSCSHATSSNNFQDGIYLLDIGNSDLKPFFVYCYHENGNARAWTIIQRRENGSISFNKNWSDSKQGFGDLNSEYWIGLDRLHAMTTSMPYEIWALFINENGDKHESKYSKFEIAGENENYKLIIDSEKGFGNYDLIHFNNTKFSTFDKDNDLVLDNCAEACEAPWWYKSCMGCIGVEGRHPQTYKSDILAIRPLFSIAF